MYRNNARSAQDRVYLNSPSEWSTWPVAPVKRYDAKRPSGPECGVIFAAEGHLTTVYKVNLFDADGLRKAWKQMCDREEVTAKHYKYDDLDALLADGWMVD